MEKVKVEDAAHGVALAATGPGTVAVEPSKDKSNNVRLVSKPVMEPSPPLHDAPRRGSVKIWR
jgi:hypothetical protein